MDKQKTTFTPVATDRLWGAIRVWGWIFIISAVVLTALMAHQAIILSGYGPSDYVSEADPLEISGIEALTLLLAIVVFVIAYFVGAFLVLRWYLRSIRNARVLHRGIQTPSGWVIWYFIVPVLSLFRPYSMTSELWRSSDRPDAWKSLRDPAILRWWWGLVLAAGFISLIGDRISQAAETASLLQAGHSLVAGSYVLQASAGVLFLWIGGRISRRQTALVASGHRPADSTLPTWSA